MPETKAPPSVGSTGPGKAIIMEKGEPSAAPRLSGKARCRESGPQGEAQRLTSSLRRANDEVRPKTGRAAVGQ
jgi:hypothetical protein